MNGEAVGHFHDDDGNIIVRLALQSLVHQQLRAFAALRLREDLDDLLRLHEMALCAAALLDQPIGAQEHAIAGLEGHTLLAAGLLLAELFLRIKTEIHHHLGFITDGTHQLVAADMGLSLFRSEGPSRTISFPQVWSQVSCRI